MQRLVSRVLPAFLSLLAMMCISGCSGGSTEGRVDVYPVRGKVTFAGGPLADAVVSFAPKEGQPVAFGRTNAGGEFQLTTYGSNDGAAPGNFAVVISKFDSEAADNAGEEDHSADPNAAVSGGHDAGTATGASGLLPPEYASSDSTPLSAKVEASGENNFTFDL
ncbi:MAG: carboxypeptidase regulatory-like domain-containing protein [Planctomycetaceae bacterium]|nr:carboxypeptidase regulatory-like domain-containing protein [Planctomycetaceae bacterium]